MYNRIWKVNVNNNGFKSFILIEGTEAELRAYIDTEIKYTSYIGASDNEVSAAKILKMPIYIAPTI